MIPDPMILDPIETEDEEYEDALDYAEFVCPDCGESECYCEYD